MGPLRGRDPARVAARRGLAAWWASWTWYPTLALVVVFTPLLFPTGRLLSPRWRLVAWPAAAVAAAITALAALQQTLELAPGRTVANPFGLAGVENPEDSRLGSVLFPLFGPLVLAAFASLVVRFRRAGKDERQQLKWITFAGALLPLTFLSDLAPDPLSNLLFAVVVALLPAAAGIAILRTPCAPPAPSWPRPVAGWPTRPGATGRRPTGGGASAWSPSGRTPSSDKAAVSSPSATRAPASRCARPGRSSPASGPSPWPPRPTPCWDGPAPRA